VRMSRRAIAVSVDIISRAIKGAKKAGVDVKTIRVEPNGAVVINGDNGDFSEKQYIEGANGYL